MSYAVKEIFLTLQGEERTPSLGIGFRLNSLLFKLKLQLLCLLLKLQL